MKGRERCGTKKVETRPFGVCVVGREQCNQAPLGLELPLKNQLLSGGNREAGP